MMKTVAIITGGSSSEREVSFWSAQNVAQVLQRDFSVRVIVP